MKLLTLALWIGLSLVVRRPIAAAECVSPSTPAQEKARVEAFLKSVAATNLPEYFDVGMYASDERTEAYIRAQMIMYLLP